MSRQSRPVAWIAHQRGRDDVLHLSEADGWSVDCVAVVFETGLIRNDVSAYVRLRLALEVELAYWEEEAANATGDAVEVARRRIEAITKALQPT